MLGINRQNIIINRLDGYPAPEGKEAVVFGFIYELDGKEFQVVCSNSFEKGADGLYVDKGMTDAELKTYILNNYKKSITMAIGNAKQHAKTYALKKQILEDK